MDKIKKIGFFEKFNKSADIIEKSSMNLQMLLGLIAAILYAFSGTFLDSNISEATFITVLIGLLAYSVAPKTIAKVMNKE